MITQERVGNCTIRYVGLFNPALPAAFGGFVHEAAEAVIRWWREKMAPRHFTMEAHSRYGGRLPHVYEKRRGPMRWMVRRWNVPDDLVPLVARGNLKAQFLGGALRLRRTGEGLRSKVAASWPTLPRYAYMFDPNFTPEWAQKYARLRGRGLEDNPIRPLRHAKYLELTIVTEEEQLQMRDRFGLELERLLKKAA